MSAARTARKADRGGRGRYASPDWGEAKGAARTANDATVRATQATARANLGTSASSPTLHARASKLHGMAARQWGALARNDSLGPVPRNHAHAMATEHTRMQAAHAIRPMAGSVPFTPQMTIPVRASL